LDGAAEADDTIKLVLPKNNPTKMVTTTAVVNIPKRVFIPVNEFITSIKSNPVKVVYLCHNVALGRTNIPLGSDPVFHTLFKYANNCNQKQLLSLMQMTTTNNYFTTIMRSYQVRTAFEHLTPINQLHLWTRH
jgi:hypothetical protein